MKVWLDPTVLPQRQEVIERYIDETPLATMGARGEDETDTLVY